MMRKRWHAMGLAVAVGIPNYPPLQPSMPEKALRTAVAGVRRADGSDPIELDYRFHIGSVTKPVTSTMIAKLIESGTLRWDTTMGEVLSDLDMKSAYRNVTVKQLLQHRSGLAAMPSGGEFTAVCLRIVQDDLGYAQENNQAAVLIRNQEIPRENTRFRMG